MKNEKSIDLYKAILEIDSVEECIQFFEDLCSPNELKSIEQRFEVAKMLKEGYVYTEISNKTNASTATISRVKRMLEYGGTGSMIKVIDKLEKK